MRKLNLVTPFCYRCVCKNKYTNIYISISGTEMDNSAHFYCILDYNS